MFNRDVCETFVTNISTFTNAQRTGRSSVKKSSRFCQDNYFTRYVDDSNNWIRNLAIFRIKDYMVNNNHIILNEQSIKLFPIPNEFVAKQCI